MMMRVSVILKSVQSHWLLFLGLGRLIGRRVDGRSNLNGARFMNLLQADQADTEMVNIGYTHCRLQSSSLNN